MKTSKQHAGRRRDASGSAAPVRFLPGLVGSTSGAALVITLSLLVLVTALVVTLFLTATNERVESSAAGTQEDAQRLRNGVVNLVKSTITQATSGYEANANGTPNLGNPTAWASQPGLISTWKHDGTPDRSFRLYSSGTLAITGSLDLAAEASTLSTWKTGTTSYNALWCDLNAPALNGTNERVYPIITPPADDNSGSTAMDKQYGVPTDGPTTYIQTGTSVIQTGTQSGIQGYSIGKVIPVPGYLSSGSASVTNNPAPMPVKWLYFLQDGSCLTPDATSDGTTVKISGSASKNNPIVGRIAYWTDDETCKVNVNTASEYFYWEAPSTYSIPDGNRAMFQPASGEYQRYPGHPSTTCLSAVFEKLGPASFPESDSDRKTRYEKAFNLAPRIAGTIDGKPYIAGGNAGGSQAGTAVGWFDNATRLLPDQDRLYATAEELLYNPSRSEQLVAQGVLNKPGDLQARLGFLTAHSTSPDVNWMNQPRISLWPLNPNEIAKWSPSDKLLAFCATLSGSAAPSLYYFQRTNGFDPGFDTTADVNFPRNKEIYSYLKNMLDTPIPTPGAKGLKFSSKAATVPPTRDPQQILTNIFDYIRCFINTRYSGGSIGTSTNAQDDPAKSYSFPPGRPANYFGCFAAAPTVLTDGGKTTRGPGGYPVITDVLLHFWAVSGTGAPFSQTTDYPIYSGSNPAPAVAPNLTRTIQMNLVLNLCNVECNDNLRSPQYQIRVSGPGWSVTSGTGAADAKVIGTGAMNFPTSTGDTLRVYAPHNTQNDLNQQGGFIGTGWLYRGSDSADNFTQSFFATSYKTRSFSHSPAANTFTFFSAPINLSIPTGTSISRVSYQDESRSITIGSGSNTVATGLIAPTANPAMVNFNGSKITIEIFPGIKNGGSTEGDSYDVAATTPIQTIYVDVPSATIPVPVLGSTSVPDSDSLVVGGTGNHTYYEMGSWPNRGLYSRISSYIKRCGYNQKNLWLMDVIRGITLNPTAPHKGDLRVLAHSQNILFGWYTSEYTAGGSQKEFFISSVLTNTGQTLSGSNGRLNSSVPTSGSNRYTDYAVRIAAPKLNGMSRGGIINVGDFDTGRGFFQLGGYYLQPDMGFLSRSVNSSFPPYFSAAEFADARSVNNTLTYSPARMVGSPIILGKLSTFVSEANPNPWETLLFCPDPDGGVVATGTSVITGAITSGTHNGWIDPKDHYLLDLFHMPVVEPYAISQPLSTDGRVNLNYQMAPFAYINRSTALYAAIKGTRAYAITPANAVKAAPGNWNAANASATDYTYPIDPDKTIALIDQRAPFVTPSEFTEVFLNPGTQAAISGSAAVDNFWRSLHGTGDDLREAPYNHIYPKLTTKSNTFTVHMRVQSLKQVAPGRSTAADWSTWVENKDQVVSEYRGSSTIERYVDPNDKTIPDFAQPANYTKNLAPYYRWRTVAQRQFLP